MRLLFIRNDSGDEEIISYFSSVFEELSEEKLDEFFDWLGSDEADGEIFWEADVSMNNDNIIVDFFAWPEDPQRCVQVITSKLGVTLVPFYDWTKA